MTYNAIEDLRKSKRFKQPGKHGNKNPKMPWAKNPQLAKIVSIACIRMEHLYGDTPEKWFSANGKWGDDRWVEMWQWVEQYYPIEALCAMFERALVGGDVQDIIPVFRDRVHKKYHDQRHGAQFRSPEHPMYRDLDTWNICRTEYARRFQAH